MNRFTGRSSSFLAGTAIYLVSNVLNAAIPFILLPILTRYLSPEEYGEIAMFQTLLGALMAFVSLSMHGAAGRKYYDSNLEEDDLRAFIGSCLQILLVTSLITLLVVFSMLGQLQVWLGLKPLWIVLAVGTTAANVIVLLRLVQWQVRKQAIKYGVLQIGRSFLNLFLSLALVVLLMQGAVGRISAQVWAAGGFAMLALLLLKKDRLLYFFSWRPDFIKEILHFGVPLIPHVSGTFLLISVDRFVINSELGLAQTGIYMVAVQLAGAVALAFDAVNKAYVPWLYERLKRNNGHEKRQIVRYTYIWFGVLLSGAALVFLIGPPMVVMIAGDGYSEAGKVIGWLILGQVFGGMYLMITNYIFFSKRTGLLSMVTIASGLINVLLLVLMIPLYGIEGAAWAFCAAMALRFVFSWWVAQKRHPMPWAIFLKN